MGAAAYEYGMGSGGPSAPPPAEGEVDYNTYTEPQTQFDTSNTQNVLSTAQAISDMTPFTGRRAAGDPGTWVPESYDMYTIGGPEGEKNYREAFDVTEKNKLIAQRGELEADRESRIAALLKGQQQMESSQMAAIAARRAEMQAETQRRQAQIDATTRMYTDDLANQGKFWMNPGNIISSIALSLMPVFGGDPAAGAKLINQNIDRDMANRRAVAETHLGSLRSSLAGYRQMMGDEIAGDLMAKSEAHRIAAMEVERVSSEFKSEAAKKNAAILIQEQLSQSATAKMNAWRQAIHKDVTKMAQGQLEAYKKSPGWKLYGDVGGTPGQGGATIPGAPYSKATGMVPGTQSPTTATSKATPGTLSWEAASEMPYDSIAKLLQAGQIDPSQMHQIIGAKNVREAVLSNPANPNAYMEKRRKELQDAVKEIQAQRKDDIEVQSYLSNVSQDIQHLSTWARSRGMNPNDLLQPSRFIGGGWARMASEIQQRYADDSSPEARSAKQVLVAGNRLHQSLSLLQAPFGKSLFGGAVTGGEEAKLRGIMDPNNPNLENTLATLRAVQAAHAAKLSNSLMAGGDPQAALAVMAMIRSSTGGSTPMNMPAQGIGSKPPRSPVSVERHTPAPSGRVREPTSIVRHNGGGTEE